MKTRVDYNIDQMLLVILLLLVGSTITSCDIVNERDRSKVTSCFTVVDYLSSNPLDSVYVSLIVKFSSGVSYPITGYTNTSGNCCLEHESGSLKSLYLERDDYVTYCDGPVKSTIGLIPAAKLQLHIQNDPPTANNDWILIYAPSVSCSGGSLEYDGANINTTLTIDSPPGTQHISWASWHNSIKIDSTFDISLTSRDTTFVEIHY